MEKVTFKEVQIGETYRLRADGCSYKKNGPNTGLIQGKAREEEYGVRQSKEVCVKTPSVIHLKKTNFRLVSNGEKFWTPFGNHFRRYTKGSPDEARNDATGTITRFDAHRTVHVSQLPTKVVELPAPKKVKEKPVVTVAFEGFQFREGKVGGETIENIETLIKTLQKKRRLYKRFALLHGWMPYK